LRASRLYPRVGLLAGVVVVALVLGLDALHGLRGLDLSSIDARFELRDTQRAPRDLVVVGIDAATFSYLDSHDPQEAHFPFSRRLDARVITNLARAGAQVIAYDEQFTEPTNPGADDALITAVRAAGNVVLATTEVAAGGVTRVLGGGAGLAFSRATPAESQFPIDPDGKVRRMHDQILGLVTFPLAVAQRALGHAIRFPGGRDATALIDYLGPSGTVPEIPYWRVLEDRFAPGAFRGRIVVVGATEPILHDVDATPTDVQMSGPEIQANAIDTVLRGFPLDSAASWLNGALTLLFGLAVPLLALRLAAPAAAALVLAGLALLALACQLAFDEGTIVGFVYPALAAVLSAGATLVLNGMRVAFERELVRTNFARFVPESVVGEALASADGARLGGVRREVTELFSDLRGFTTFAEQRGPDETIEILNRHLTEMTEAILEHGGTLVGYLGDGIHAVFGAPIAQSDHADRALAAAREMLARQESFNAWLHARGQRDGFKMGIGLNSGPVMSGNVGAQRRLEYTTIGDTTNTASRIEGMTKGTPHQLYVSGTTYARLAHRPDDLVYVGELEVRGRADRVTVWALVGDPGRQAD
jgi:adenylate cyclase